MAPLVPPDAEKEKRADEQTRERLEDGRGGGLVERTEHRGLDEMLNPVNNGSLVKVGKPRGVN